MLKFTAEQKTYTIAGVEVGGQPGQRPTLLIGSIFFSGHKIVKDNLKGVFDKDKARALLDADAEASARTGNPRFIDVIGDTGPALINYLEFVAGTPTRRCWSTPSRSRCGWRRCVTSRAPKSRRGWSTTPSLKTTPRKRSTACVRAASRAASSWPSAPPRPKPKQRIKLLTETLLPVAARAGIENILVDPGVLDIASIGWTALAIRDIKETLGYPCGCAPSNALFTWEKLRSQGQPAFEAAAAATFTLTQTQGADFVHYGPIRNAPWVYQAVATADAMTAYAGRITGVRPVSDVHPLYRIF